MKVLVGTVGIGGWYPRGVARMVESFYSTSPGIELMAWINTLPAGAPSSVVVDGYDYGPYCAKPFAMRAMRDAGADVAILLDAAFWPIRPIHPLVAHISQTGYYLCENGFQVGEWCADSALAPLRISREQAWLIPEASSYCVGLGFHDSRSVRLVDDWCGHAADGVTFPGRHTAGKRGRNPGFVSVDSRVRGHRHDQTALSVIAMELDMDVLVPRPKYTAYLGHESAETVLINHGEIING